MYIGRVEQLIYIPPTIITMLLGRKLSKFTIPTNLIAKHYIMRRERISSEIIFI